MKINPLFRLAVVAALAAVPFKGLADIYFNDTFSGGSTLNSASPASPTATSTAYQIVSSKAWTQTNLAPNLLRFGIAATSSGSVEAEALFTANPVALVQTGDYIQMTVVFTNFSGLLMTNGQLGFGLFNASQVKPLAGGLNGTATTAATYTGGAQHWLGYVGQINFTNAASRIMTRPDQTATSGNGNNQDVLTSGSGSSSYVGAATVGTTYAMATAARLAQGSVYTEVLSITLSDVQSLAITNTLYAGPNTSGVVITNFGGIATNTTYLTGGFDALAIGYRGGAVGYSNVMDVSSIQVSGSVTAVVTPPAIVTQPVGVTVSAGGSTMFDVVASGFNLTYQWHRFGTNLVDNTNISGSTSSMLVLNNVSAADVASGANGYYVTVTGAGNLSTNSATNSLTLGTAKNLIWAGTGTDWDLNTTADWTSGSSAATFNYGDAVTFNDVGASSATVTLDTSFLSASKWTITGSTAYGFSGSGSFAGNGVLVDSSSATIQLNNVNTHTGGTIISNATALLYAPQYQSLGAGPLTLALAGGKLEVAVGGSATVGIAGDVNVNDSFTIQFDGTGSYAGVFLGNLAGTAGKQLTLTPQSTAAINRYRVYGTNLTYNANLVLNDGSVLLAPYQSTGIQTYNGVISGAGAVMHKGTTTYFNGANTYSGGMNLSQGAVGVGINTVGSPDAVTSGPLGTGPLLLTIDSTSATTGSGMLFASGGARTIGNTIEYPSGTNNLTLIVGGTNSLTMTGSFMLNGVDNVTAASITARTVQVTNTASTTLSGVISDNSQNYGFIKTGNGALYLNAANTYTGPTTNSGGLLAGSGTIPSAVYVQTNANIGGGSAASIGTLTISGNLSIAAGGGGYFRLNKSNGQTSDRVSATGTITSSSTNTLVVTNLGTALATGDSFTLFNKAVTGGGALAISGGGVTWSNRLAIDGTILVVPGYANYSTNITAVYSSGTLTISWPSTHQGWILQAQTNALTVGMTSASNTWYDVSGSSSSTQQVITVNPVNPTVFYRLRHP